jgi:hypothetical protein
LPVPLRTTAIVGFVDELLPIVSCPVTEPVDDGLNVRVTVIVFPGLRVAGRLVGDAEKPLPLTVIELTVTEAVPVEVRVTVWVVGLFNTTPPNAMLVAFTDSAGVPAFNWSETVRDVLPVVAVSVADCALLTEATFAVNAALAAVAGTRIEPGTVTAALLLDSATVKPPVGAEPDRLTEQESVSVPVIETVLQLTALTVGVPVAPVALRLTADAGALLDTVNCPLTEPAVVG